MIIELKYNDEYRMSSELETKFKESIIKGIRLAAKNTNPYDKTFTALVDTIYLPSDSKGYTIIFLENDHGMNLHGIKLYGWRSISCPK